jgi:hypothetical protein
MQPADNAMAPKKNKKILVILISVLLGAAIGFSLSYIVLNSEVQNLQTALSDLEANTKNQSVDWHLVTYLKGNSSLVTGTFIMRGKEARLYWWMAGEGPNSWINIGVYFPNGTFYASRGSSGVTSNLSSDILIETSNYYFNVTVFQVNQWTVAVWDYY